MWRNLNGKNSFKNRIFLQRHLVLKLMLHIADSGSCTRVQGSPQERQMRRPRGTATVTRVDVVRQMRMCKGRPWASDEQAPPRQATIPLAHLSIRLRSISVKSKPEGTAETHHTFFFLLGTPQVGNMNRLRAQGLCPVKSRWTHVGDQGLGLYSVKFRHDKSWKTHSVQGSAACRFEEHGPSSLTLTVTEAGASLLWASVCLSVK